MAWAVRRNTVNLVCSVAPFTMSLLSLVILGQGLLRYGMNPPAGDEGAAAHLFQLLMVTQVPLTVLFAATSDWKHRPGHSWAILGGQASAWLAVLGLLAVWGA